MRSTEKQSPPSDNPSENGGELKSNNEFSAGVASDCNSRYRKTMEDAHVVLLDFMDIPGMAYFGVFDGHAGAQCATAASENLHNIIAEAISAQGPQKDIAKALNTAFTEMDKRLQEMNIKHSGSTAVVSIVCNMNDKNELCSSKTSDSERKLFVANAGDSRCVLGVPTMSPVTQDCASDATVPDSYQHPSMETFRLSYDHRCADVNEQKRVVDAGGLMINNRVNGMLAVTRSLGDLLMKDYVVGNPYTTETTLKRGGELLVIACDGLWDVCSDEKAVQIALEVLNDGGTTKDAANKLIAYALDEYSADNLTVMVVIIN